MKRTGRIPRYTRLVSGKPVKKRNAKRYAKNQTRAYAGQTGRVAFVRALPCLICGCTPSENAHVTNGGMSRKGDAELNVPLCGDGLNGHHREYDEGKRSFVATYAVQLGGLTMLEHAARVEAMWQEHIREAA